MPYNPNTYVSQFANQAKPAGQIGLLQTVFTAAYNTNIPIAWAKELKGGLHHVEYKGLLTRGDIDDGILLSRRVKNMLVTVEKYDDGSPCNKVFRLKNYPATTYANIDLDWEELSTSPILVTPASSKQVADIAARNALDVQIYNLSLVVDARLTLDIVDITQGTVAVVEVSDLGDINNGNIITITNVENNGMTQLTNGNYKVVNINQGNNTFELYDISDNPIDSTLFDAYTGSGGTLKLAESYSATFVYAQTITNTFSWLQLKDKTGVDLSEVLLNTQSRHTQNTDSKLDEGGANEVSAITLKSHIDDADKHRHLFTSSLNDALTVTNPIGNIDATTTIAQLKLKSWWKILEDMLFQTIISQITTPKAAFLTRNQDNVYEVGTSLTLILTAAFNRGQITTGDSNFVNLVGAPVTYDFTGAGITGTHTETTNALSNVQHTTNSFLVVVGTMNWGVEVTHDADSTAYNDSTGTPETHLDAQRVSGTEVASVSLIGRYKTFYGGGSAVPTTSNDVRALSNNVFDNVNSISFNTGTTNNIFTIAIPATKNLVSVINTNNNVNLTGTFILDSTLVQVEDANGDLVNYKVYNQVMAIPYSNSQNYQIQLN